MFRADAALLGGRGRVLGMLLGGTVNILIFCELKRSGHYCSHQTMMEFTVYCCDQLLVFTAVLFQSDSVPV